MFTGCHNINSNKNSEIPLTENHISNSLHNDSNHVNDNLAFMLSKKSRFENEVQQEKLKFNQLLKKGFETPTSLPDNHYLNTNNSIEKRVRKVSFTIPVPEPVWNEYKQELEFKWVNNPKYTLDTY